MRIRRAARTLAALGFLAAQAVVTLPASAQQAKPAPKPQAQKPAAPKPAAGKPQPGRPKKGPPKHTRKAGEAGEPDEAVRRAIAGTSAQRARESAELKAMRELDRALFPGAVPGAGAPWLAEGTPLVDRGEPHVVASGLPPAAPLAPAMAPEPARDLSWLHKLTMPDIPVRWDARVVRYLEFYKNNARGRSMVAGWIKKSGRYGAAIRRTLKEHNVPEDVLWLALVESGFDPTISSPAGAAGLWQFMPEGARIYGLHVDRWIDERMDPERSTIAAARYLADLHTRFGTWELAFAAYNMGYGGLLSSIRKYNTNDFWELSRLESGMPLETALYVPKIVAMAIVARNRAIFGLDDVELDPAAAFDKIAVRPGVSMQSVALAAGTSTDKIGELNPQILAARTPPASRTTRSGRCACPPAPLRRPPRACPSSPRPSPRRCATWCAGASRSRRSRCAATPRAASSPASTACAARSRCAPAPCSSSPPTPPTIPTPTWAPRAPWWWSPRRASRSPTAAASSTASCPATRCATSPPCSPPPSAISPDGTRSIPPPPCTTG
jgi:membrane-bound lytic murein transglycosylase D